MLKTIYADGFELTFDREDVDDDGLCEIEVSMDGRINPDDIEDFRNDLIKTSKFNIL